MEARKSYLGGLNFMQKTIKIDLKNKVLTCEGREIKYNNMTISGIEIFNFLDYNPGDKYDIEKIDLQKISESDRDYFSFFNSFILDLIEKINNLENDNYIREEKEKYELSILLDDEKKQSSEEQKENNFDNF